MAGGAVIVKEAGGVLFDPWVMHFIPHEVFSYNEKEQDEVSVISLSLLIEIVFDRN